MIDSKQAYAFQYHWVGGDLNKSPLRGASSPGLHNNIYDLASITKVICTGTLLAKMFVECSLTWNQFCDQKISSTITELKGGAFEDCTLREFWEHRSGLRAHDLVWGGRGEIPLSPSLRAQRWNEFLVFLKNEKRNLSGETIYSDLGFLVLGLFIERRLGKNLQEAFRDWKSWANLSAHSLDFLPDKTNASLVPTENRHPVGEVNDDNASALGGVAPHAGLFGTAENVWDYLVVLSLLVKKYPKLIPFLDTHFAAYPHQRFHCGWDRPSLIHMPVGSVNPRDEFQSGHAILPGTLGHLGFTGTALWWDPSSLRAGVFLSNRVHPEHNAQNQSQIKSLRHRFFTELWEGKLESDVKKG